MIRQWHEHIQWHQAQLRRLLHSGRGSTRLASTPLLVAVKRGSILKTSPHVLFARSNCRSIRIPPILLPPVVFAGLLVALWIWYCVMMVVFQNKIIYMPGLPPTSRRERIADWEGLCGGIRWTRKETVAVDGTKLAMAVTTVSLTKGNRPRAPAPEKPAAAHVYVLYFHGNASSIPPRLPGLSWVLRAITDSKTNELPPMQLMFVCLSYRGYWTSRGRPSEPGLRLDAEAGVRWIAERHEREFGKDGSTAPILLVWGQSIGSGVATNLAATGRIPSSVPIRGLLLETPFVSIKAMLEALYPQKWLPYKYLWPFLRNHLDSWANLGLIAQACRERGQTPPMVYILEAERDELVPKEQSERLYQRCVDLGLPTEKGVVPVAYHQQAIARGDGKKLAAQAITKLTQRALGGGD
ncbi:alpha/beta-hydrolase [Parathielavia appendiculata]|uniref:Alpha/beta-hydrolase n=1 Tax=Parathielavia appendiculata TaxID=2587402 RepID=A0AAN6Z9I8_9PEZI|nr:alpha/beta-hydrolase [Parathielavia appendiculata]